MPDMKKIGIQISICMGITLSFFLSLTGILTSGHFSVPGWLMSFVVSAVVSLIIGFCVPMKKVGDAVTVKRGMKPGSIKARLTESLVSDLIYTPLITVIMVTLAYFQATSRGAQLKYAPMLIKSLIICMIVGFVLIFIFQPIYMKLVFKKNGVEINKKP